MSTFLIASTTIIAGLSGYALGKSLRHSRISTDDGQAVRLRNRNSDLEEEKAILEGELEAYMEKITEIQLSGASAKEKQASTEELTTIKKDYLELQERYHLEVNNHQALQRVSNHHKKIYESDLRNLQEKLDILTTQSKRRAELLADGKKQIENI